MPFYAAIVLLVVGLLLVFLAAGPLHVVGIVLAVLGGVVLVIDLFETRRR